jgi:biopolymer transport protein ExbB/TolQ
MNTTIEGAMYGVSQLFLVPVLILIAALFAYAFVALGAFVRQAWQRRKGLMAGFELQQALARQPGMSFEQLEALALKRLELVRVVTRVAPMLGLVATMIPMGPALKSLADGQIAEVSRSLMVAFSAVILALIAAAITHAIAHVRKRWYAADLLALPDDTDLLKQGLNT